RRKKEAEDGREPWRFDLSFLNQQLHLQGVYGRFGAWPLLRYLPGRIDEFLMQSWRRRLPLVRWRRLLCRTTQRLRERRRRETCAAVATKSVIGTDSRSAIRTI